MTKAMRFAALLLAVMVCFVMLLTASRACLENEHACTGEQCPLCVLLFTYKSVLKHIAPCAAGAALRLCILTFQATPYAGLRRFRTADSPVLQKVKLSN